MPQRESNKRVVRCEEKDMREKDAIVERKLAWVECYTLIRVAKGKRN